MHLIDWVREITLVRGRGQKRLNSGKRLRAKKVNSGERLRAKETKFCICLIWPQIVSASFGLF